MRSFVGKMVRYLLGCMGFELSRSHTAARLLKSANLATVIDGGANDGVFASQVRAICPTAAIHSFEPVPWIFQKLISNFEGDAKFHAYQLALSDANDYREFEINRDEYSSSLLPMRSDATRVLPTIGPTDNRIRVETIKLDSWSSSKELSRPTLLKLDIEGNELAALRGSTELLDHVDYILMEISFVCIRNGQPTFREIVDFLGDEGFEVIDIYPGIMDSRTGQSIWADALFSRKARTR